MPKQDLRVHCPIHTPIRSFGSYCPLEASQYGHPLTRQLPGHYSHTPDQCDPTRHTQCEPGVPYVTSFVTFPVVTSGSSTRVVAAVRRPSPTTRRRQQTTSMASRELTARWLTENTKRYRDPNRVYADVIAVLDRSPALRPKTDIYSEHHNSSLSFSVLTIACWLAYDDGRTLLLLCIHGLLPISFRGASYNIPIALWLPLAYPSEPPLVYVVPTADMLVKPSASIDLSGRCSLEYTAHWARKPDVRSPYRSFPSSGLLTHCPV